MDNKAAQDVMPEQLPTLQTPTIVPVQKSINWTKISLLIILGLFAVAGSVFASIQIAQKPIVTPTPTIQPINSISINTPSPSGSTQDKEILALFNEKPKSRTVINVETWKIFEDKTVGIRFKYPPEWGEAHSDFQDINDKLNNPPLTTGWVYYIQFSNHDRIYISGASKDMSQPRGGCSFRGFETIKFPTPQKYCNNSKDTIYCQPAGNGLHVLTGTNNASKTQCIEYDPLKRIYYLNRPSKIISGIVFASDFLSNKYDLEKMLALIEGNNDKINALVLERRLDTESISNYDTLEKLFETIEEI